MDASPDGWYFSTMARRIEFHRTKYGRELLIDAAFVRQMPTFLVKGPHELAFHDILVVTRGRGRFRLDGVPHRVVPGVAFFTRPGELREWRVAGLDGACLFFDREFVREVFADPRFLDQFPYFADGRPSAALRLAPAERRRFLSRFREMQREIAALEDDAPDALRAVLYETLVLLGRAYAARFGAPARVRGLVERYRALLERDFARRHRVAEYARELGVSPGHLNALVRAGLRSSAGALLRERRALEARRLLAYGGLQAAQVAERLGFDDPAYFARFMRRETGRSPTELRGAVSGRASAAPPRRRGSRRRRSRP
jgi:AraC-like DNA-binding protein